MLYQFFLHKVFHIWAYFLPLLVMTFIQVVFLTPGLRNECTAVLAITVPPALTLPLPVPFRSTQQWQIHIPKSHFSIFVPALRPVVTTQNLCPATSPVVRTQSVCSPQFVLTHSQMTSQHAHFPCTKPGSSRPDASAPGRLSPPLHPYK